MSGYLPPPPPPPLSLSWKYQISNPVKTAACFLLLVILFPAIPLSFSPSLHLSLSLSQAIINLSKRAHASITLAGRCEVINWLVVGKTGQLGLCAECGSLCNKTIVRNKVEISSTQLLIVTSRLVFRQTSQYRSHRLQCNHMHGQI